MNRELAFAAGPCRRDCEEKRDPACSQINEDGKPIPQSMDDKVIKIFVDTGNAVRNGDMMLEMK
ncbi:MAG: hypothetical protein Q8S57_09860 [Methanoregula sp.]|nr:hypothetical protein [Methanoregula sp.]